jgi:hypothetical protein
MEDSTDIGEAMKKLLIFALVLIPSVAVAAPCETKVCVQVVTDPTTNQIVITAVQNKPGATAKPKPAPKPKVTRTYTPRPYTPRPYTPRPKPKQPVPKVAVSVKPKVIAAVSLSDRLTQLLPQRNIFYVPKAGAVVQVPMYFWTDATKSFATTSMILGISVGVTLTPTFVWDFGDGNTFTTSAPGAAYPDTTISHTYKMAGTYKVSLLISWGGTWSAENNVYPVLGGNIVQKYSATFVVANAPTKFIK